MQYIRLTGKTMTQTFKLYRLQQIDSQIDHNRTRLNAIEATLSENEALRQAETQSEAAAQTWQAACKILNQAEVTVRDHLLKIEQIEATLYSGKVRNPKELQDMQNEVGALKRYRVILEDRQLDAMLQEEDTQTVYQAAAKELERIKEQYSAQHKQLMEEKYRLTRETSHLEEERRAAVASIPNDELQLYENLRRQRIGVAVAKVTERACSACGSVLSTALLASARSPSQTARCDTCGRLLYAG